VPTTLNPNAIPAKITSAMLYEKAGSNRLPERVVFDGSVYDGTKQHADNPMEAIDGFKDAIYSTFEETERVEKYPGFTMDEVAVALNTVMRRLDGFVSQVVKTNPMDKPSTRRVPIGFSMKTHKMEYVVVPAGATTLPWRGKCWIMVGSLSDGTPYIKANVIRGDQSHLEGLFVYVREWANANSIYLGQVVDTNFTFVNMTQFDPTKVALTDKMRVALDLYVRGPLKYMDALKEKRQDTKTGLLMYGPPGGGKTVGVSLCEFQAIVAGAVVIHVDPSMGVMGLDRANNMAIRLMEAGHTVMISFEDMEKLAEESRSKVLEILDGAQAKNAKRIIVGTTNFIEGIDRAMIRHGRFDDVLYCGLPDRSAFEQVIRVVFDADNLGEIDFDAAFPHFEGYSYATITNAGSKVIRAAINRMEGDLTNFKVTTQDLIDAANLVRDQHTLMNEPVEKPSPFIDDWFRARMAEAAAAAAADVIEEMPAAINYDYVGEIVTDRTDSVVEGRLNGAAVGSSRIRTN
jgi:hypothetical protein